MQFSVISIHKHPYIISRILSFIQIYLSFLEILKECLMKGCIKHPYNIRTRLVGRKITSSLLMYQYCIMVMVFQNFLSSMTKFKRNISFTTFICGKLSVWKGAHFFAKNMDSCIKKPVETFVTVSISDM